MGGVVLSQLANAKMEVVRRSLASRWVGLVGVMSGSLPFSLLRFSNESPQPLKRLRRTGFYGTPSSIHVQTPAGPILVPVRHFAWRMIYD